MLCFVDDFVVKQLVEFRALVLAAFDRLVASEELNVLLEESRRRRAAVIEHNRLEGQRRNKERCVAIDFDKMDEEDAEEVFA
jgi:hypothetical protein